jgi:CTP:molybdopterin cytidylyltransferase MocA
VPGPAATPILIAAAGRSSRMGGADKLALPVDGEPLLRRIARAALAAGGDVHVALPAADHPRAALLAGLPVTRLALPEAAEGLSGTLRAGVAALPECARFMVLLADLPEIGAGDIRAVLDAPAAAAAALIWRGATAAGEPGHPILFDARLRPAFAQLRGDAGGEAVLRAAGGRVHLVPLPGGRARLDLDTPADWAAWRAGREQP